MSPDTLRKLRKWLTLDEAASELSTALSEDVDASEMLRLVLDGQLETSPLRLADSPRGWFCPLLKTALTVGKGVPN